MGNLIDYIRWRGDLLFSQDPFNEVDNLILSQLVYLKFDHILSFFGEDKSITVEQAVASLFLIYPQKEIKEQASMSRVAVGIAKEMAKTKRFGKILLFSYVNEISISQESQFSVVQQRLDDGSLFVSFCGTDNTIVGWKENFNMSFLSRTPGQLKAVEYLNSFVSEKESVVRIGGHSKGGNLAVYGSVFCNRELKDKIVAVYNNDGPGFSKQMLVDKQYLQLKEKIHTIIPQSSFVGLLLEHEESVEVIASQEKALFQHDPMTWEVLGTSLVRANQVTEESIILDHTLKNWVNQMSIEEREEFVDSLFSIMEKMNIHTTDELTKMKGKTIVELIKTTSQINTEKQKILSTQLYGLWKESQFSVRQARKLEKEKRDNG